MNSNDTFLQLLDVAQLRSGKKLKLIAKELDCHPTYLSRIRSGKQNAGPSITMALRRFVEGYKASTIITPEVAAPRGMSALQRTAEKFGVDPDELLEALVMKHGWAEAQVLSAQKHQTAAEFKPTKDPVQAAASKGAEIAAKQIQK